MFVSAGVEQISTNWLSYNEERTVIVDIKSKYRIRSIRLPMYCFWT